MNALAIVNKLLEAEPDDFSPEAAKEYALGAEDYLIQKLPPEVAARIEYAPHEFKQAFFKKEDAEWDTSDMAAEADWWPSYDDDDDTWRKTAYYSEYRTEDGKLIQMVKEVDTDGNHDFVDEAEVGTPEWHQMLEPYAFYQWMEQNAKYSAWVVERGEDPLDFFMVSQTERYEREWLIGFTQAGDRARFWKAREVGVPGGSPPATENPEDLPQEVRAYINIDANRINQDATWPEIVAMTQTEDRERPTIKTARDGTRYAEFRVKLGGNREVDDYVKKLKEAATKAFKRERREASSARRQHRKNPHYTV